MTVVNCEVMELVVLIDATLAEMLTVEDDETESEDERIVVAEAELSVLDDAACGRPVMDDVVESDDIEITGLPILLEAELVEKALLDVPP